LSEEATRASQLLEAIHTAAEDLFVDLRLPPSGADIPRSCVANPAA